MRLKADLVRTLVERWRVDAVFFESGVYDFLKMNQGIHSSQQVDAGSSQRGYQFCCGTTPTSRR